MSETKPGGPRPESEESSVVLPPDLEQERKEIEAAYRARYINKCRNVRLRRPSLGYCPDRVVTRKELAQYLYNSFISPAFVPM